MTLFAEKPEGAQYLWDFGDGAGAQGRFVSHVYGVPGLYRVQVLATVKRGLLEKRYRAETYFKVLAPPEKPFAQEELSTKLFSVTLIYPSRLAIGETGQFCLYATAKEFLTVFSGELAESYSLIGDGEFSPIWLRIPSGRTAEHCVTVRRVSSAEAFIEYHFFGATDRDGARADGRVTIAR